MHTIFSFLFTLLNKLFKKYSLEIFNLFIENNYDCYSCFQSGNEIKKLDSNDIDKINQNNVDWIGGQFLFVCRDKLQILSNNEIIIKN